MRNFVWLCPYAMLGLAMGILVWFGFTVWSAFLVVLLLVCPSVMLWGAWRVRSIPRKKIMKR